MWKGVNGKFRVLSLGLWASYNDLTRPHLEGCAFVKGSFYGRHSLTGLIPGSEAIAEWLVCLFGWSPTIDMTCS